MLRDHLAADRRALPWGKMEMYGNGGLVEANGRCHELQIADVPPVNLFKPEGRAS